MRAGSRTPRLSVGISDERRSVSSASEGRRMEIRKERIGDPFVATVDGRLDSIDGTSAAAVVSRMVKRKRASPASDSLEADFGSKRTWATRRGAFQYFHVGLPLVPGCRGGRPRIRVAGGACERNPLHRPPASLRRRIRARGSAFHPSPVACPTHAVAIVDLFAL